MFDKTYKNRKDWRKPYRDSRAFDRSCRSGGGCIYCEKGRQHKNTKKELSTKEQMGEFHGN